MFKFTKLRGIFNMINNNNFLVNLSPKKIFNEIIESKNPEKIVKKLNPIALLTVMNEVGSSDFIDIMEYLSPRQVLHMLDFAAWQEHSLNPIKTGEYLNLLLESNKDKAIAKIRALDREFLGLLFKKTCTIYDLILEEEPYDYPSLYSLSPDGRFLVAFKDDKNLESLSSALHCFLESMYAEDMVFALHFLEDLRFEMNSSLEESAYTFRNHRLGDFGILPKEESLELLAPLSVHQLRSMPSSIFSEQKSNNGPFLVKSFHMPFDESLAFIKEALEKMNEEQRNFIKDSLAHTSLNIHFLLNNDISCVQSIRHTCNYVSFLLDLGVFRACQGKKDDAHLVVQKYGVKQLIRLGRSLLLNLRELCFSLLKDEKFFTGDKFHLVDSPLREVIKSVCSKEPLFYEGLLHPQKLTQKYFTSHAELNAVLMAINETKFRSMLVSPNVLGLDFTKIDLQTLSHSALLARVLLNEYLEKTDTLGPLHNEDFDQIFVSFASFIKEHTLKEEVKIFFKDSEKMLLQKLDHAVPNHNFSSEKIQNFISTIMIKLEQNYHALF